MQQVLATANLIRKCDQLVTGDLTKGAKRALPLIIRTPHPRILATLHYVL